MKFSDIPAWLVLVCAALAWTFSLGVIYSRIVSKLNGLGGRLTINESSGSMLNGRVDRMEREVGEMHTDLGSVHERLGRVEKGVEGVTDGMNALKIDIGSHFGEIKQLIIQKDSDMRQLLGDRDTRTRERVARLEAQNNIPHRESEDKGF